MVDAALRPGRRPVAQRRAWVAAILVATVAPFAVAVGLAPSGRARPVAALTWLLFVGSSMHVAATAWFYCVPEVRAHMSRHRGRYLWAPLALVAGLAAVTPLLPSVGLTGVLLAFFAWQFFHFQKQNLGVAALAARAGGVVGPSPRERRALVAAGAGGIAGLLGHPGLLQLRSSYRSDLLFGAGAVVLAGAVCCGLALVARRPASDRPSAFVVLYASGLLFFAPVFLFASPYAAVAGLTIAHGLQYLLLVTLLAAAPARGGGSVPVGLLLLMNVALLLGLALNRASHLHDGSWLGRAVFGAYLGLSTAHFVVDAGLWRLRDEFPRRFLTERLPYLLGA